MEWSSVNSFYCVNVTNNYFYEIKILFKIIGVDILHRHIMINNTYMGLVNQYPYGIG